jgi:glycerophosphoryl diester phosphodiesterase
VRTVLSTKSVDKVVCTLLFPPTVQRSMRVGQTGFFRSNMEIQMDNCQHEKRTQQNLLVIGHRGACGYAPENTIASFEKACALGCDMIEFDVMLSEDGVPFIFHDENLKRTTNGRGEVGRVSAEYIRGLDAGAHFSKKFRDVRVPDLKEVILWFANASCQANLEIKPYPGTAQETTQAVLMHLTQYWPRQKPLPLVSSFDLDVLYQCRALSPELPLGLLLDKWVKSWHDEAKALECYSVHLSKRAASAARVQEIKALGYRVYVYTVNRKRLAKKLLSWGVDAVFSDYPDKIRLC